MAMIAEVANWPESPPYEESRRRGEWPKSPLYEKNREGFGIHYAHTGNRPLPFDDPPQKDPQHNAFVESFLVQKTEAI